MANLANGDVYPIGADLLGENPRIGDELLPSIFEKRLADVKRELTDAELRADEALRRGDPIVLVDDVVAQKLELGTRELARRQRRRRARRS